MPARTGAPYQGGGQGQVAAREMWEELPGQMLEAPEGSVSWEPGLGEESGGRKKAEARAALLAAGLRDDGFGCRGLERPSSYSF